MPIADGSDPRWGSWFRAWMIVSGAGILAVLITARILTPDPRGFGTHEQLGLPACGFMHVSGFPCPSCGMTTAWAHVVRGELAEATRCNWAGMLSGLTALVVGPWALVSGWRGRWFLGRPPLTWILVIAAATYLAMAAQWLVRLGNNS